MVPSCTGRYLPLSPWLSEAHFFSRHPQDLPEQPYLQPPLSILVIERRAFGRTVLVGSHIVPRMMRFILQGPEDVPEEEEGKEEAGDLVPPTGPQGVRPTPWWSAATSPLVPGRDGSRAMESVSNLPDLVSCPPSRTTGARCPHG